MSVHQLRIGPTSFAALAVAIMATPAFAQSGTSDEVAASDAKGSRSIECGASAGYISGQRNGPAGRPRRCSCSMVGAGAR